MLARLAVLVVHRARAVVIAAVALLAAAAVVGSGVADQLVTEGTFEDRASESFRATEVLEDRFDVGAPDVVLVVTARSGTVDDPDVAAAGRAVTEELAAIADVEDVVSYWSEGNAAPLRSDDSSRALVLGRLDIDPEQRSDRIAELSPQLRSSGPTVSVDVGGSAEVSNAIDTTIEDGLGRAELIAVPVTLLMLVLIFGSVVAATLPVVLGVMSILGTFLVLRALTEVTDVAIWALNLTTALGLGLAIDYSLLVVSRFREELAAGHEPPAAVSRTVRTAGRTVAFSALTVAASLFALVVFPFPFLRSMAYSGAAVAVMAGLLAVVVLPAILRLLGRRVDALTVMKRSVTGGGTFWRRMAIGVMRRPLPVATGVIAVLLVVVSPFRTVNFTLDDDRVLPESAASRQVGDTLRSDFSSRESDALSVVALGLDGDEAALADYASELARLPGVGRVDTATGTYCGPGLNEQLGCQPGELVQPADTSDRYSDFTRNGDSYLSVLPAIDPLSSAGEQLVGDVRATPAPVSVMVTGPAAELVDTNDSLFDWLPLALGVIAAVTFVLLFMMFGSVLIPLKAILLNLLSLTAMFGAMVWVFQDGNLSGLLDFTATGGLFTAIPILMFCVAFGLSMDYEVFLLSRIKEQRDAGATNEQAVATGLQRSGRIITAAAALMAVVFTSFAITGDVSFIKLFGIGLTLAVLLDAFVIRGTLVPAFMRLAGDWNWWAPPPLQRIYQRWGIRETTPPDGASSQQTQTPDGSDQRPQPAPDDQRQPAP